MEDIFEGIFKNYFDYFMKVSLLFDYPKRIFFFVGHMTFLTIVSSSIHVIHCLLSIYMQFTCIHCNEKKKKINYLDALEDETGAASGGSSFTLGLAD